MSAAPIAESSSRGVHRSQSASARHASQSSPARAHASRPSADQSSNLPNVARRDFEQSNLAQPSSRRSESKDRPSNSQYPVRSDSLRNGPRSERRYASIDATSSHQPPTNGMVADHSSSSRGNAGALPVARKRASVQCSTGTWLLGKTIGQGSMGKVKLAKNQETGEQVAVKIVPRQSTDEHRTPAERERADHSKEIRTAREAAIVSLVNHPYICGMRDVYRTPHHWYMLFEYVNGGQMLDYIISHGRLKEKGARKFARQIASALDYCHRNSIVHRDLKIENILISKTGDIKIIDFGLSNLFSPRDHLKTFCGSLYFAAPELLQAKQYTGPEVDIWSFGVVLYVLVCGKVPFDDQSMPQLHAKIKKGNADYPPWLTNECKNLISRMLVTDPRNRASLQEIMNHPWMTKGFSGPPENHLPHREPLQLPLDSVVIQKMTGFDFGPPEYITNQLTKVIDSEEYQRAVRNLQRRQTQVPDHDRSRGMFGFYKRRNSATSRDTLTNPSSEAIPLGSDPINAFSPLVSIYYLVREKLEHEKLEANPGVAKMPHSPGEKPLQVPDLPAPPAAYTNPATYEMKGESTGGRTRPRARTRGEDEIQSDAVRVQNSDQPTTSASTAAAATTAAAVAAATTTTNAEAHPRKESTAGAILRRISTRRRKPDLSERDFKSVTPAVAITSPSDQGSVGPPPRKSYSVRRKDEEAPSSASLNAPSTQKQHPPELLTPPASGSEGFPRRFMSLRRAASVDRRRLRKNFLDFGEAPAASGSDTEQAIKKVKTEEPPAEESQVNRSRSSTTRTKSLGHARRESIQARRAKREEAREQDVKEETDAELAAEKTDSHENHHEGEGESLKPVFLKGLFSVSTTSSKSLPFIRSDIIRVLKQLGIEYKEVKGGFQCWHSPSLKDVDATPAQLSPGLHPGDRTHRRKISLQAFKYAGSGEHKDKEYDGQQQSKTPQRPSGRSHPEGSPAISDAESETKAEADSRRYPRGAGRDAGATSTHVRDEIPRNTSLEFEIFIVKVPLLSLHGIQFKKVDGNIMQYKNMAQRILGMLRL